MAQFDLKKATIYLEDGYSEAGAVNNVSGYLAAATTMKMDGVAGIVPTGATFKLTGDDQFYNVTAHSEALGTGAVNNVAGYTTTTTTMTVDLITGIIPSGSTFTTIGDSQTYTITAHTETLGNTTSITFTPGLVVATVDDQVLTFVSADTISVTFTPGLVIAATNNEVMTFAGIRLELKIGEGNLTYDEKRTMEYKRDRGQLDTVREGDEEPIDVRLDVQWEWLSHAAGDPYPTPEEFLKKEGLASGYTSSSSDPCEPYAINLIVIYDPDCSGVDAEVITLSDYRWESLNHDLKAGTLSTSGKCNVTRATKERLTLA